MCKKYIYTHFIIGHCVALKYYYVELFQIKKCMLKWLQMKYLCIRKKQERRDTCIKVMNKKTVLISLIGFKVTCSELESNLKIFTNYSSFLLTFGIKKNSVL